MAEEHTVRKAGSMRVVMYAEKGARRLMFGLAGRRSVRWQSTVSLSNLTGSPSHEWVIDLERDGGFWTELLNS